VLPGRHVFIAALSAPTSQPLILVRENVSLFLPRHSEGVIVTYEVDMKSKSGWVTHCQNERLVLCCVKTIERINVQPVLGKDLWKPSDVVWSLATGETIGYGISHMS
jgi:hypothetical protein